MSDLTPLTLTEIPHYTGPHAIPGVRFRPARAALGVTAWGMNVLELDAHCDGHPEHDHAHDGQEELYVVLSGQVELVTPEQRVTLSAGQAVRVPADRTRKLVTRDQGATILALGGTPGQAFTVTPGM